MTVLFNILYHNHNHNHNCNKIVQLVVQVKYHVNVISQGRTHTHTRTDILTSRTKQFQETSRVPCLIKSMLLLIANVLHYFQCL